MNKILKVEWLFFVIMLGICIYSIVLRFSNPELTETQLFLKMIGF